MVERTTSSPSFCKGKSYMGTLKAEEEKLRQTNDCPNQQKQTNKKNNFGFILTKPFSEYNRMPWKYKSPLFSVPLGWHQAI